MSNLETEDGLRNEMSSKKANKLMRKLKMIKNSHSTSHNYPSPHST